MGEGPTPGTQIHTSVGIKKVATSGEGLGGRQEACTYLVDHIRQQTLHFISIHGVGGHAVRTSFTFRTKPNRCRKFVHRDPGPPHFSVISLAFFGFIEATRDEDLAKQVSQRNVPASLEGKVDATLHKFSLARLQGGVKSSEIAAFDSAGQWCEEGLQSWVRGQKGGCWQRVRSQQMAWDEVCQDQPACG